MVTIERLPQGRRRVIDSHLVLTPREWQVLQRLGQGMSNLAIARDLGIAYKNVEGRVHSLMGKLDASGRGKDWDPRVLAARAYWEMDQDRTAMEDLLIWH